MTDARWITVKEFCTLYGLSPATAYIYAKTGQLECMRVGKNRLFVKDPGWDPTPIGKTRENLGKEGVHLLRGVEVAKMLGVTPRAVRYMAQHAKISDYRSGNKPFSKRRYSISDVRQMIAMRETKNGLKQKRKRGPAIRAAVLRWALEQLKNPPETN